VQLYATISLAVTLPSTTADEDDIAWHVAFAVLVVKKLHAAVDYRVV